MAVVEARTRCYNASSPSLAGHANALMSYQLLQENMIEYYIEGANASVTFKRQLMHISSQRFMRAMS